MSDILRVENRNKSYGDFSLTDVAFFAGGLHNRFYRNQRRRQNHHATDTFRTDEKAVRQR